MWFRQDLRLSDNPALAAAVDGGSPVLPLFILDDSLERLPGGASRWWLHGSLESLAADLARTGAPLVLRRGDATTVLAALAAETGAARVVWNRCYEPAARARDTGIKQALKVAGVEVQSFNGSLLHEPWTVETKQGGSYGVYSPFARACFAKGDPPPPIPAPAGITASVSLSGDSLADWQLLPSRPDWAGGLRETWQPGEAGARARLASFLENAVGGYKEDRNRPDMTGTSGLSPHLHWGDISPRTVWQAARSRMAEGGVDAGGEHFLKELLWREFSYHLLYHHPELPSEPLRENFAAFPWAEDPEGLAAWQQGRTGFPIVDAGMRELWHTGWMHNRVRMIAASFLVKDLLVPWQDGERWFWDTLVDADLANNAASWQWVAGCGADAAPYFRIFNPVLQGQRYDPAGAYVRRWVPEIAALPDKHLHAPWEAPPELLAEHGICLGETYPAPIVDHAMARDRALAAYERIRKT